jgi:hypothetical protein
MPQLRLGRMRVVSCVALTTIAAALGAGIASGQDAPPMAPPLAPAITDMDVAWAGDGRIRLRAQVVPRGAQIEKVVFRYRRERFKARKGKLWNWARTVEARGGDRRGDQVRFRVRACTATVCSTEKGRDVAD